MSPSPAASSWVPSCAENDTNLQGEQDSCASVDSGLSDSATPPHDSATPPVMAANNPEDQTPEIEDRDDLSSLSGLSDMSGQEWKPNMSGKLAWLHRAMARGEDPRGILVDMLPSGSEIPEGIDSMTLWKVLFNLLSEPPKRSKLSNVNTLEDCVELIKNCSNIVVLTGAGVSVSCGIPDFRSKDGVYARLAQDFPDLPDPQAMFDIHYFRKDPRPFFKFAREIYPGQFKPSPCHNFIRAVESSGKLLRNYTQNIDTLEQVAGIEKVVQCHGSFATASCMVCKVQVDAEAIREDIFDQKIPLCNMCPKPNIDALLSSMNNQKPSDQNASLDSNPAEDCLESSTTTSVSLDNPVPSTSYSKPDLMPSSTSSDTSFGASNSGASSQLTFNISPFTSVPVMKPDIVFFGEGLPDHFHNSISRDKEFCDLLIVIGSSLKVRPVALIPSSLPPEVPQILINREPLPHCNFDVELLGDCDSIINQICLMLGEGWELPVHAGKLLQHPGLPPEYYKAKEDFLGGKKVDDKISDNGCDEKADGKNLESITEKSALETTSTEKQSEVNSISHDASKSEDGNSDDEDDHFSRSIAEYIPDGKFLFLPPARYVFTGAEVYPDTSDDEIDEDDEDPEDSSDPPCSATNDDEGISREKQITVAPPDN